MNCLATSAVRRLPGSTATGSRGGTPVFCGSVSSTLAGQPLAAKDDSEAMFLHRLDEDFHAGDLHFAELDRQRGAFGGGDATRAAVLDGPVGIQGDEVAADGNILGSDGESDASGFEDAAADNVFEGIVAEKPEMARAAAGGNAELDWEHASQNARFGQPIQIGRFCRLQFGRPTRLHGQTAEAVGDQHDDLRVVILFQAPHQVLHIHLMNPRRFVGNELYG